MKIGDRQMKNKDYLKNKIRDLRTCQERLEMMKYHKIISKWEYKKISKKIRKNLIKTKKELKEWGLI